MTFGGVSEAPGKAIFKKLQDFWRRFASAGKHPNAGKNYRNAGKAELRAALHKRREKRPNAGKNHTNAGKTVFRAALRKRRQKVLQAPA